jgi:serine/threonine protein kinase/WD40 repeat protein/tetratricopeptide (TPR) repeat protein
MAASKPSEQSIFLAALELPTLGERAAYVRAACGDDLDLRAAVEALLAAPERPENILDAPLVPAGEPGLTAAYHPITEGVGTVIGPYKLLQQIGEGGFGVVFMAEQQEPVRRRVALKIIKPGLDSAQVVARFEAERQALAMMDHQNIARVLDAGTTAEGRPYFVMELVHGVPITTFCDENRLTPRQRLELFVPVCQAIQHAHQKGIIHRDIKPSNVLVTLYDDKPVPKVIDFGVAKAIEQRLTERTMFTQFGTMVGTYEYMSPEQAAMNAFGVDTRSDIYSLGVLLYELLTGTTPLSRKRLKEAAFDELLRLIKDEEPPKPSTRLSTAQGLATIAAARGTEPAKLLRLVQGEVDWIVMKCLEKDRTRRYETANGLARDISRYLRDEPVEACPPSAGYKLKKFARKHRSGLAVAAVLAALLVAGTAASTWQAIRAMRAEKSALAERDRAVTAEATAQQERDRAARAEVVARTDRDVARQSELSGKERLYRSLLSEAKASRFSQRIGQRFNTLKAVREATQLARELNKPPEAFEEPRRIAIAALALPDLKPADLWVSEPDEPGWATTYYSDFDPNFTRTAITNRNGTVSIRRVGRNAVETNEIIRLPGLGYEAVPRWSPDGRFVAFRHYQKSHLQVWQVDGPAPRLAIDVQKNNGFAAFSPDSRRLVSVSEGQLRVYQLPDGKTTQSIPIQIRSDQDLAYHPRLDRVALAATGGIQILDLNTEQTVRRIVLPGPAVHVAWHPDGELLAATNDHAVYVCDAVVGRPLHQLDHPGQGIHVAFNQRGDLLATSGWSGGLRLWNPYTGALLLATDRSSALPVFGPGDLMGQIFSESGKRSTGRLSHVESAPAYRSIAAGAGRKGGWDYSNCSVHSGGRLLAVSTHQGLSLMDLLTGGERAFLPLGTTWALFEPSGSLLTATTIGIFRWPIEIDTSDSQGLRVGPPQRLPVPVVDQWVSCLATSADGEVLAAANEHGAYVWHRDRPREAHHLTPHEHCRSIAVNPGGSLVATGSRGSGGLKVWDVETGKLVRELDTGHYWTVPSFSPDGRLLMNRDGQCWRMSDWSAGPRHVGEAGMAFAPDMRLAASGGHRGFVPLFDPSSGRELARLEDPNQDVVHALSFTADGTQLLGVSNDSFRVRVWDLRRIRAGLTELGLDWEAPSYPPASAAEPNREPLRVQLVGADTLPIPPTAAALNLDESIATHRRLTELEPKSAAAFAFLGVALSRKGLRAEEINAYRKAIELDPDYAWAHSNLGNALRAQQELDEAVAEYSKAIELQPDYAYAYHGLGLALQAQQKYAAALAAFKRSHELGSKWASWKLPTARLIQETERLVELDKKLPRVLNNDIEPANAGERAEFASLCRSRRLYAAAARLFAEAFEADPELAEKLPQHRYDAACAAVLAGCGQGWDEPPLNESQRANWRAQALNWLRAQLAMWTRSTVSDQSPDRAVAGRRVNTWRNDPNLAGVRDAASLTQLPEEERALWQEFWKDVDALLKKHAADTK